MSAAEEIAKALQNGARAGARAASTAGRDLTGDIYQLVLPNLGDISIQIASIVVKHQDGTYTDATAKALIAAEEDAIQTLLETVTTLAVLEVQTIYNAMIEALYGSVNTAVGFTLLV